MSLVANDDIARYRADGFITLDRIISDQDVANLRARYDHLFRGEFETGVLPDEVNWQEGTGDPTLTRQICNGWKADRHVARIALSAEIGRAIAELAGWRGTRIMQDNVLWKPSGARPLGFHQDSAYLRWFKPNDLTTCWIALDDTSAASGTIEYARGSHQWDHLAPEGEFHGPKEYRKSLDAAARHQGVAPDIVPIEVPAGGCAFHDGWTWHGSGDNRSPTPRRALAIHAMRDDVEYDPENFAQGTGPIYARYRRFADTLMDENHFPVLWREDGYRTPGLDAYIA